MSVTAGALRSRRADYEQADETAPAAAGGLKLLDTVVALALAHRLRFFGALLGPPMIAVLLIFLLPPVYRAQISLLVTGPEQVAHAEGGSILAAPAQVKKASITAEVALLSNPELVESTVTRIGVINLYPELSAARLGPQLARDTAIRTFETALRVEPDKLSNAILVTFDHSNGHMAARALDQFVVSYQDLHAKVFSGRRAAGYEQRLGGDMQALQQLERERAEMAAAVGVLDVGQQRTILLQQRAEAEQRLRQTADQVDLLSKRLAYLAQTRPSIGPDMLSGKTESNPSATHAAEALADLRQKEASLMITYDSQHPLVKRVREQIDEAQRELSEMRAGRSAASASPGTSAADQDLVATQEQLAPLKAQQSLDSVFVAVISQKLQRLDDAAARLRAIDSKIADQTDRLQGVLRLYNKASKDDATDQANLTTVVRESNATTSDGPVSPNKLLLLGGGLASGLIAAALVIAYAMSARRKSIDAYGLFLGLPVLDKTSARVRGTRRIEK